MADDWFKPLEVKGDFNPETLDAYFVEVQQWLKEDMQFLRAPIAGWRGWSWWIRGVAFVGLALGIVLPLPLFGPIEGWPGGLELGYVAVLIGGLALMFDQVFSVSSSWMRLTLAEMQVKQVRYRLDLEWAKARPDLKPENAATVGPALIDILKAAADACHEIMETQKESWTSELKQGMELLRSRLDSDRIALQQLRTQRQQQQAGPKNGAVNLTIDKPAELKGPLSVKIGNEQRLELATVPAKVSVNDVPAGLQTITVSAARAGDGGKPFAFMVTETIVAGEAKAVAVAVT
jgi:hypothetical protein